MLNCFSRSTRHLLKVIVVGIIFPTIIKWQQKKEEQQKEEPLLREQPAREEQLRDQPKDQLAEEDSLASFSKTPTLEAWEFLYCLY